MMDISLKGYQRLVPILLPLAALYLLWRARKQPDYLKHWSERFATGTFPAKLQTKRRVWIHAVSVGETNATRPLVKAILKAWPECDILLTHMTPTGRDAGQKIVALAPERIQQCFLPYDARFAVQKFFQETAPDLGIIMETEVWPTLLSEAKALNIPLVLANARLSEKSYRQAMKFPRLMTCAMHQFDLVCAQATSDQRRLEAMSAKNVTVTGSLKFDIQAPQAALSLAKDWKKDWSKPVVLLASTRDGEEALFIDALKANARSDVRYLLVPRHPQRFNAVEALLKNAGIAYVKRSDLHCATEVGSAQVILGDTMGEMFFYCALADVCIMGGSFQPFGCQNVIEPTSVGVPVIVGPSTFNFSEVVKQGLGVGALQQVQTAKEAIDKAHSWLNDPVQLNHLKTQALVFSRTYVGATARIMKAMEPLCKKFLTS